jgi:hypothetical protein
MSRKVAEKARHIMGAVRPLRLLVVRHSQVDGHTQIRLLKLLRHSCTVD